MSQRAVREHLLNDTRYDKFITRVYEIGKVKRVGEVGFVPSNVRLHINDFASQDVHIDRGWNGLASTREEEPVPAEYSAHGTL